MSERLSETENNNNTMPMVKEISQIAYVLPANGEEIRNRYLYEIFTQVNKIVKKKEKK